MNKENLIEIQAKERKEKIVEKRLDAIIAIIDSDKDLEAELLDHFTNAYDLIPKNEAYDYVCDNPPNRGP